MQQPKTCNHIGHGDILLDASFSHESFETIAALEVAGYLQRGRFHKKEKYLAAGLAT